MSGPYQRPWSNTWFTKRPGYMRFMVRELTAVFVGAYLVFVLVFLWKLGGDRAAFVDLLATLKRPSWMALHAIALVGAVWHSVTWFNLTPKAMPVRIGESRVADPLVAIAMGYVPWIVVTVLIAWAVG